MKLRIWFVNRVTCVGFFQFLWEVFNEYSEHLRYSDFMQLHFRMFILLKICVYK